MKSLVPNIEVKTSQMPKLFADSTTPRSPPCWEQKLM